MKTKKQGERSAVARAWVFVLFQDSMQHNEAHPFCRGEQGLVQGLETKVSKDTWLVLDPPHETQLPR